MLLKLTPDANTEGGSSASSQDDKNRAASSAAKDDGLLAILKSVADKANVKDEDSSSTSNSDDPDDEEDDSAGDVQSPDKTGKDDDSADDGLGADDGETDKAGDDKKTVAGDEKKDDKAKKDSEVAAKKVEDPKPLTEDEIAKLPFHKHERFQQLVRERRDAVETVEKTKPLVQQAEQLNTFCRSNNVTPGQLKEALEFVALLNSDPAKAAKQLEPVMQQLQQFTGDRLPTDLATEVDEGKLTPERAKEIAHYRSSTTFNSQRTEQQRQQQFVQSVMQAGEDWQRAKRVSDPDFESKFELINDRFNRLLAATEVKSVADVTALLEKAHGQITAETKKFTPAPARRRNLSSNGSSSTARQEPKSFEEAVMAAGRAN